MALAEIPTGEIVRSVRPLTPAEAQQQAQWVREVTKAALTEGTDYGVIPGTGSKPTLLKPGAEMLLLAAGLGFTITKVDDQDAREHQGVTYRCTIKRGDQTVSECDGYAGYDERRFAKNQWRADWNSVIKMAQKRALVGAALNAVAGSGLFTQDVEDDAEHPAAFDAEAAMKPLLGLLDAYASAELKTWWKEQGWPAVGKLSADQAVQVAFRAGLLCTPPDRTDPAATTPVTQAADGDEAKPAPEDEAGVEEEAVAPSAESSALARNRAAGAELLGKAKGQQLHRDLGRSVTSDGYGMGKQDQEDLIFCVTNGRTSHASEMTVREEADLRVFAGYLKDGRMTMGDVHRAAQEHRDKTLHDQLEGSLAQTEEAAVRDFDEQIAREDRRAS